MKVSEKCVGCGQCAAYCPYDAIIVFGRAATETPYLNTGTKCAECCICVDYCPVLAISEDG